MTIKSHAHLFLVCELCEVPAYHAQRKQKYANERTLKAWFKFGVLCFYKKIVRPRTQRERKVTIADRNK